MDVLRRIRQRVCLQIDLPEALVQLRQRQLDSCLHRVGIDRRQMPVRDAPCRAELAAEHGLHQLHQHGVLGVKQVLEAASRYACILCDLGDGGFLVPLLQKQTDAYGEDLLFRFYAVSSHLYAAPPHITNTRINYIKGRRKCQSGYGKKRHRPAQQAQKKDDTRKRVILFWERKV